MRRPSRSWFAVAVATITVAASLGLAALVRAATPDASTAPFVKGVSWGWVGARGEYRSPAAADSMKQLAQTGADWVCIAFGATMETPETPRILWGDANPQMAADEDIRAAIDVARDNGLKVILKPVVNCSDGTWRAWIKFYRPVTPAERARGVEGEQDPWADAPRYRAGEVTDSDKWAAWWSDYDAFILHYAELASAAHCEMFCLGCEMNSTEANEVRWRDLIGKVRARYQGLLTYDVNHHRESEVAWWNAVDVIGVSAYYHVPPPAGVTEEEATKTTTPTAEIVAELRKMSDVLAGIHEKFDKPILFIETGVTNVRGCARHPWAHPDEQSGVPLDEIEQRNYYQAMFDVFWDQPWFMGYCWWDWPASLYAREAAAKNRGFCIYGKQAEDVVRQWYAKPR